MGKDTSLLKMSDISKSFGSLEILKDIELDMAAGETVAIVGPSGSGKSTLLHIAGLMDHPSGGDIILDGKDTTRLSETERARFRLNTIGFVFQFHHLLPDFNVLENVLIPSRLADDDLTESEKEARSLLKRLGLEKRLTHKPYELSGGEQQRTALARALIRHPKLLLCDEPTGNLDPDTAVVVSDMIREEIKREGVGALIVTHNDTIAKSTDRYLRLVEGRFEKMKRGAK
jgi:lipoprotein-releasing system ATP-binding protein